MKTLHPALVPALHPPWARMIRCCWLGWLILLMAPAARAATELSLPEGLSQNAVLSLARDADGFLWIGTEDGLNRFDGYEFSVFRAAAGDRAGTGINHVRGLVADGGHLFLATSGGGLAVFERATARFRVLGLEAGLPAEHLTSIALAGPGDLYVGSRTGLARLRWNGDPMLAKITVEHVEMPQRARAQEIWELIRGAAGLWVGTGDGLFRIDPDGRVHSIEIEGAQAPFNVDALLEAPAGVLWIGTWSQGLIRHDLRRGEPRNFLPGGVGAEGLRSARVLSLAEGPDGILFVGTDRGLAWLDPDCSCLKSLDHPRAARVDGRGFVLLALDVDPDGGVFAGFWGEGLVRLGALHRSFHVERPREEGGQGLRHGRVGTVLETRSGELLVGSFGGGVQRVDGTPVLGLPWRFTQEPFSAQAEPGVELVWELMEDRTGRLWAGTDDGLYWRDAAGQWQPEPEREEPQSMRGVRVLAEDGRGRLWVGSSSGLARIDGPGQPRRRVRYFDPEREPWFRRQDEGIQALFVDAADRVWIGTAAGLHILGADGQPLARYRLADGLPGAVVNAIHQHVDGSIWLATNGGVAKVNLRTGLDALRFELPDSIENEDVGAVHGLLSDRRGRLWLGGNRGLLRFDPERGSLRRFTRSDGLAADEFSSRAMVSSRRGWFLFGGIDGLTVFDPLTLPDSLERPRPRLAAIELGGVPVVLPPAAPGGVPLLRLGHAHPPLLLDFSALVFDGQRGLRYRARLGEDKPFSELGPRRSLSLDRLAYGSHLLELEVDNQGLVERSALLAIKVTPPLTSTWSFRILTLLLLAGVLAGFYLWRVAELTAQRRRLAAQVEQRTRELSAQKDALEATAHALAGANERLRRLSLVDELTGLANRRSLIERLQQAAAQEGPRVLALIDLDHFKRINDGQGHQAGDEVLRDFAQVLRLECQGQAVAGRWGGEEFLCLLPGLSSAQGEQWAGRLLERVRARRVEYAGTVVPYTVSLGLALARPEEALDQWLARTDTALYRAKAGGRDCYAVDRAADLPGAGGGGSGRQTPESP
ncbi:MAG: diguanylate cyclase [Aquimonas sp.]|nr:diguanylate cyclase [Aquimonas sp.]